VMLMGGKGVEQLVDLGYLSNRCCSSANSLLAMSFPQWLYCISFAMEDALSRICSALNLFGTAKPT
jgi:hypothetical protein